MPGAVHSTRNWLGAPGCKCVSKCGCKCGNKHQATPAVPLAVSWHSLFGKHLVCPWHGIETWIPTRPHPCQKPACPPQAAERNWAQYQNSHLITPTPTLLQSPQAVPRAAVPVLWDQRPQLTNQDCAFGPPHVPTKHPDLPPTRTHTLRQPNVNTWRCCQAEV